MNQGSKNHSTKRRNATFVCWQGSDNAQRSHATRPDLKVQRKQWNKIYTKTIQKQDDYSAEVNYGLFKFHWDREQQVGWLRYNWAVPSSCRGSALSIHCPTFSTGFTESQRGINFKSIDLSFIFNSSYEFAFSLPPFNALKEGRRTKLGKCKVNPHRIHKNTYTAILSHLVGILTVVT